MIQNKPLVTNMFTADPSAHVFDGKIYIYPSHDPGEDVENNDNGDQYNMRDYHVFEMADTENYPKDCGEVLHLKDVPWASKQLWAPDCNKKGDTYYFIFPARDKEGMFRLGIATGKNPGGPFKAEPNPIPGSYSIDPCLFNDTDGEFYCTFGGIWGGQLDQYRNNVWGADNKEPTEGYAVCGKIAKMAPDMKSFAEEPREVVVLDENGEPLKATDHDRRYFEGPCQFKRGDTYYFTYSTGDTHNIVYATSKNVYGPYTYGGVLLKPVLGWTNHHYCVEFNGKWYLFYHDCELSKGVNQNRNIKFCELKFNDDGSIDPIDALVK